MSSTATNSSKATVAIYSKGGIGSCYVDDIPREKGDAPSNHNLLKNSNFEYDTSYG